MTTRQNLMILPGLVLGMTLLLAVPASAEPTVAEYVELSIARLELARAAWSETGEGPTEAQEEALCESYGVSTKQLHRYAGKRKREIAEYLEAHPELAETIQTLSDELASLIEQTESAGQ